MSKCISRTSCSTGDELLTAVLESAQQETARCEQAIDEGMKRTIFSSDPANFPVKTAPHCRMCNFLSVCEAGKKWVAENWAEDPW